MWPLFFDVSAEFFYGDPNAPRPHRPTGVGVLGLIERDGRLLMERRSDCGRRGFVGARRRSRSRRRTRCGARCRRRRGSS